MNEPKGYWNVVRAEWIDDDLRNGKEIPHTLAMLYYAEGENLTDEQRKEGLNNTIAELELLVKESEFSDCRRTFIEGLMKKFFSCARSDIINRDYWDAIEHVRYLESKHLQNIVPEYENLTHEMHPRLILAKVFIESVGGKLEKKE